MPKYGNPAGTQIKINGQPLSLTAMKDLRRVQVQEDLNTPNMFSLTFYNWDDVKLTHTWSDKDLFTPGRAISISLGYVDDLHTVMSGEITSLEPVFEAGNTPTLMVRGYDRRHRLQRQRHTRTFTNMKDSAIVRKVAMGAGLRTNVKDTGVVLEYVLQHNQTDLAFLQQRAKRIGYELYIQGNTLHFHPPKLSSPRAIRLTLSQDLISFYPRLTTMNQVGKVTVRGWDVTRKKAIVSKATSVQNGRMGSGAVGPKAATRAFGAADWVQVSEPVSSKGEADKMAHGHYDGMALSYITGQATCYGRADIKVGSLVNIAGAGRKFSGHYYVTSTTHSLRPGQGYQTQFSVKRNAT